MAKEIVALYSRRPGCGKSTAAQALCMEHGFVRVSFADPLRKMVGVLLQELGYDTAQVGHLLHEGKEEIIPELGVSTRHLLRTLGTEWGRDCVHPNLWVKVWKKKVAGLDRVVTDDLRFPNELEAVRYRGGTVIEITRPGTDRDDLHRSDGALDDLGDIADCTIQNSSSIEALEIAVTMAIEDEVAA